MQLNFKNVLLRPLAIADVDDLYAIVEEEPEIFRFLLSNMDDKHDMVAYVETALINKQRGLEIPFVVINMDTDEIVGCTRVHNINSQFRNCEIGNTWYSQKVRRTHFNTACKYLLLNHLFSELDMVRVGLKADARNERSINAILRIGATHEGILRKDRITKDGYIRDAYIFSFIDTEWPEKKEHLERLLNK